MRALTANPRPNASVAVLPRTRSLKARQARPVEARGVNRVRRRRGEDHPSLLPLLPNGTGPFIFQNIPIVIYSMSISLHSVLIRPFLFVSVLPNCLPFTFLLFTPVACLRFLVGLLT